MTSSNRKHKTYTKQFKEEMVALVTEQGYTVIEAAEAVGQRSSVKHCLASTQTPCTTNCLMYDQFVFRENTLQLVRQG